MINKSPFIINTRELALDIIIDVFENNNKLHNLIFNTLKRHQHIDKRDRAFITRICNGTVKHCISIDYIIDGFASIKVKKMKPLIRNLLRISLYQFFYMQQVPVSAICNEAVKIAKKRSFGNLSAFINGVLRKIAREYKDRDINLIKYPNIEDNLSLFLSIKYSMPLWIVDMIINQYGHESAKKILIDSLKEKKITARTNLKLITSKDLIKRLRDKGLVITQDNSLSYSFRIENLDYLEGLEEFKEGYFTIQDYSSMLVTEVAGVKENDFVVDLCAAPGGKSLHISEKARLVSARDLTKHKIALIKDNIKRMKVDNIETKVFDATQVDESIIAKADLVILDLPCSGLGVLRKKADIKYKLKKEMLDDLIDLQRKILSIGCKYVKKGGTLIYSTCTINKDENLSNINWFLENFDFELEDIRSFLPSEYKKLTAKEGYIQLLPGIDKTDGFFIARLKNIGEI